MHHAFLARCCRLEDLNHPKGRLTWTTIWMLVPHPSSLPRRPGTMPRNSADCRIRLQRSLVRYMAAIRLARNGPASASET